MVIKDKKKRKTEIFLQFLLLRQPCVQLNRTWWSPWTTSDNHSHFWTIIPNNILTFGFTEVLLLLLRVLSTQTGLGFVFIQKSIVCHGFLDLIDACWRILFPAERIVVLLRKYQNPAAVNMQPRPWAASEWLYWSPQGRNSLASQTNSWRSLESVSRG